MGPAISIRRAVALLGRFPALAGADLHVERGETVHLYGPNGAGKTTLLRVCAGLVALADGSGEVLGHDLARDRRPLRRLVGLLDARGALYDDLTVGQNVTFAVKAAHADPARVGPALDRLGLAGRLRDVAVGRLSTGQRRRTAFAVLVARRPQLWLLDEPHAGLDDEGRDLVDELVRDAVADGATVVFASHESDRARPLARRALRVAGGAVMEAVPC